MIDEDAIIIDTVIEGLYKNPLTEQQVEEIAAQRGWTIGYVIRVERHQFPLGCNARRIFKAGEKLGYEVSECGTTFLFHPKRAETTVSRTGGQGGSE